MHARTERAPLFRCGAIAHQRTKRGRTRAFVLESRSDRVNDVWEVGREEGERNDAEDGMVSNKGD